jgi:hypothetical protein
MEQVIGKLNVHPKEQLTSEVDISVVEVNRVIEVEVEIFLKTCVILKSCEVNHESTETLNEKLSVV